MADVQVPCARYGDRRPLARARFRWRPAAMGGACGATPRLAAAGCAKACRPRRWRFAPVRHEGRFTDKPPGFAMAHPRHASTTSSQSAARSVLACRWGVGLASVRAQAGEAVTRGCRVGHVSIRERAARASLACRESWRWHGCALGFMAATFQRKQFPLRCAHSSRDKFFSLPGSPRYCDRCAVRPAHPPPAGSQQGRTGATLFKPKGEKHHG